MSKCPICGTELVPAPTDYEISLWHCPKCNTMRVIDDKGELLLARKSPGVNWYSLCVGRSLAGKKFASKAAQKQAFKEAVDECLAKEP